MHLNGIVHVTSAPYHPSTNGLAERAVQSFKQGIKRITGSTIQERLSRFLFQYRITPHTTTGVSPAELLMGRCLRSRLDSLFPDISQRVEVQQQRQKQSHDSTKPLCTFAVGDLVYAQNFSPSVSSKWIPGTVVQVTGPLSYRIELSEGGTVRRHVDNVRKREHSTANPPQLFPVDPLILPDIPTVATPRPNNVPPCRPPPRRSNRTRVQPDWFNQRN